MASKTLGIIQIKAKIPSRDLRTLVDVYHFAEVKKNFISSGSLDLELAVVFGRNGTELEKKFGKIQKSE